MEGSRIGGVWGRGVCVCWKVSLIVYMCICVQTLELLLCWLGGVIGGYG